MEEQKQALGAQVGGTVVATFVTIVVILAVSTLVAFLMSLFQYYMGNMRWEAAIFIGNVVGGIASIYAARSACDAVIKHYSLKAIFSVIAILVLLGTIFQVGQGFTQETIFRLASIIPMAGAAWFVFWKNEI